LINVSTITNQLITTEQVAGLTKYDCAYYPSGEWRIPRKDTYPGKCKTYQWCYNGILQNIFQCTGDTYVHKASNGTDYCTLTYAESHCGKEGKQLLIVIYIYIKFNN